MPSISFCKLSTPAELAVSDLFRPTGRASAGAVTGGTKGTKRAGEEEDAVVGGTSDEEEATALAGVEGLRSEASSWVRAALWTCGGTSDRRPQVRVSPGASCHVVEGVGPGPSEGRTSELLLELGHPRFEVLDILPWLLDGSGPDREREAE